MFEREIKFIYDFNLNKVNKLGPYFTYEQLLAADLHPAILCYISAEIDFLIFEDRQKLLKNSAFDYSGEQITILFNQITEEVKRVKRFSLEYIAKLILHATSFNINYLVRPRWTIAKFIYDESKHKTSNEIKQILNYVYYYKYLRKIIISYINSKKILSMNLDEFEALLAKTDKLGLESNFKGIMASSLESIAEFFNIGQMQKTKIPLAAVQLFLEEKDLPHHLQKLEDVLGVDENARYSFIDYMKVISSVSIKRETEDFKEDTLLLFDQKEEVVEDEEHVDIHESEEETELNKKYEQEQVQEEEQEKEQEQKEEQEQEQEQEIDEQNKLEEIELDEKLDVEEVAYGEEFIEENDEYQKVIEDDEIEVDEEIAEIEAGFINRIDQLKAEAEKEEGSFNLPFDEPTEKAEEEIKKKDEPKEKTKKEKLKVVDTPDEEITIKQHQKIRIKVKEDNKLEPVNDYEEIEQPQTKDIDDDSNEKLFGLKNVFNADDDIEEENKEEEVLSIDVNYDDESPEEEEFHEITVDTGLNNSMEHRDKDIDDDSDEQQSSFYNDFKKAEMEYEAKEEDEKEELISEELIKDDYIAEEKKETVGYLEAKFDLNELLENHNMTRIIEVIFDYDIEDFSNAIDEVSRCRNTDDAHLVINQILTSRKINKNSKEAVSFKEIIEEYFNR